MAFGPTKTTCCSKTKDPRKVLPKIKVGKWKLFVKFRFQNISRPAKRLKKAKWKYSWSYKQQRHICKQIPRRFNHFGKFCQMKYCITLRTQFFFLLSFSRRADIKFNGTWFRYSQKKIFVVTAYTSTQAVSFSYNHFHLASWSSMLNVSVVPYHKFQPVRLLSQSKDIIHTAAHLAAARPKSARIYRRKIRRSPKSM